MAAVTAAPRVQVRPPRPGDGQAVAALWRELWDVHESWGGYPGSKDDRVYDRVAARIEQEARLRRGGFVLGRHLHVLATRDGVVAGQVEGWIDRYGVDAQTPSTCEVRSLVVAPAARTLGLGRVLLDALGEIAADVAGRAAVLAAEVLEPNPAHTFYARVGFTPVAYTIRMPTDGARWPARARYAGPRDAHAVAVLEAALAARRRAAGDTRFDPPRAVDASWLRAIGAHLNQPPASMPAELVATDAEDVARASGSIVVMNLDPPFSSGRRAALTRVALDPAAEPAEYVPILGALGAHVARQWGAPTMEITDLSAPGTPLHAATLSMGAVPWSRIVTRTAWPRGR